MINNKAKSFVMIMIVIAVCALLLRIIIEKAIEINITQNESQASATLKLISTALENYAKDNKGIYPEDVFLLTSPNPPYLDKDYLTQPPSISYNYSCPRLETGGYSCYATPAKCKLTGKTVYNISTGSLLVAEPCERKEQ